MKRHALFVPLVLLLSGCGERDSVGPNRDVDQWTVAPQVLIMEEAAQVRFAILGTTEVLTHAGDSGSQPYEILRARSDAFGASSPTAENESSDYPTRGILNRRLDEFGKRGT